jgi:hypothetical protein
MDETPDLPSESEMKAIEKLLSRISKKVDKPRRTGKTLSEQARRHLSVAIAQTLSEYVDCYILFGFDTHGNSTVLINTANNMESRALSDLVDDFMAAGQWNPGSYTKNDEPRSDD